jgi:hypothetical protein
MKKELLKRLEKLEKAVNHAKFICDPLDFAVRQNKLLYELAEFILEDLKIRREKGTKNKINPT